MNDDTIGAAVLIAVILACAIVVVFADCGRRSLAREAVRLGHAEFNQTTGAWQWKTNVANRAWEAIRP